MNSSIKISAISKLTEEELNAKVGSLVSTESVVVKEEFLFRLL
jgi:hypothetical protein